MFKAFDFCIPTRGAKVPSGLDWLHEVKYDGYRLRLERDGSHVRVVSQFEISSTRPLRSLNGTQKHVAATGDHDGVAVARE